MPHDANNLAIGTDRTFRQQIPGFPGTFLSGFGFHIFSFLLPGFCRQNEDDCSRRHLVEQNYRLESGLSVAPCSFIVIRNFVVVHSLFTADGIPDPIQNRFVFGGEDIRVFAMNVFIIPPFKF